MRKVDNHRVDVVSAQTTQRLVYGISSRVVSEVGWLQLGLDPNIRSRDPELSSCTLDRGSDLVFSVAPMGCLSSVNHSVAQFQRAEHVLFAHTTRAAKPYRRHQEP